VYSLGAVIYEMLSGQPAYPGEDLLEVFAAIAAGDYVPLRQRAPGTPARMVRAVNQSLVFNPDNRVHTAGMLLEIWTAADHEMTPAPIMLVTQPPPATTVDNTPPPLIAARTIGNREIFVALVAIFVITMLIAFAAGA
jgi:serine/threonine protein kinase